MKKYFLCGAGGIIVLVITTFLSNIGWGIIAGIAIFSFLSIIVHLDKRQSKKIKSEEDYLVDEED